MSASSNITSSFLSNGTNGEAVDSIHIGCMCDHFQKK